MSFVVDRVRKGLRSVRAAFTVQREVPQSRKKTTFLVFIEILRYIAVYTAQIINAGKNPKSLKNQVNFPFWPEATLFCARKQQPRLSTPRSLQLKRRSQLKDLSAPRLMFYCCSGLRLKLAGWLFAWG